MDTSLQHYGAPAHRAHNTLTIWKKENVDFIKPDMWSQTALILIQLIMRFVIRFSNESIREEISHGGRTEESDNHRVAKLSERFIDSSISEWRRRFECVVKDSGGHMEHCNLSWTWTWLIDNGVY